MGVRVNGHPFLCAFTPYLYKKATKKIQIRKILFIFAPKYI